MLPDNIKSLVKRAVLVATVIPSLSLIVAATSHSQTITDHTSILSSIQRPFDWRGTVKAVASNSLDFVAARRLGPQHQTIF